MSETIVIGELSFALERSPRRKTLGISVERGGDLIIRAPAEAPIAEIERLVRKRAMWVHTKLAERDLLVHAMPAKEYISGEGFYYLGRHYRLKLVDDGPPLQLQHGWFCLRRDGRPNAEDHFARWYIEHAQQWLQRPVALLAARIGVAPGQVRVQDLGYRWGSCGPRTLNFHWRTIQLPPAVIEYVIAHELVHLVEHNHSPAFWHRLGRAMPDFERRKQWLAEQGHRF